MKNQMPNNCKSPELCLLSETCVPCGICPNAKDVNNSRSNNPNRTETMNIQETPTPETDALVPTQGNKQTMLEYIETLEAHARDLERRLTIAREALKKLDNWLMRDAQRKQIIEQALIQTAPKP